jgi:hypothetical protein
MPSSWSIYHVKNCIYTKPLPKDKFVAIMCNQPLLIGFFINTEIRPFIQHNPDLLKCQVKIQTSHYRFLDYDSYINCSNNPYQFNTKELTDFKCSINMITKAEIIKVVRESKTLEQRYQKMILANI